MELRLDPDSNNKCVDISDDFDWEEQLSRVTGDVVAHQFGKAVRSVRRFVTQSTETLSLDITEYLQEEARLLPAKTEIMQHLQDVDRIRADTDRLDARLHRLLLHMESSSA